ncbi:hypothetical protein F3087_04815 [Nocardia colli]|uniref:Uncharacterized protein n=1 Tax=Nocardia colli TaxID=2545717 RepID=A0A5N0EN92_9NOCA|nr:hypothetical protein [Nocardia colli]KAA8890592.1 hypothetical protein F3087_04815 [Nocardia colli]
MSRAGMAEAARAVATARHANDTLEQSSSAVVRVFNTTVGVAYLPNAAEITRRQASGLAAVTQMDLLDVLMGLPIGLPIAVKDLTGRERRLLRRAPAGIVDIVEGQCTRQAVPPLSPQFAVVSSLTWKDGLRSAGQFAPFCSRVMLLRSVPDDLDDARVQASFFGIGICVFSSSGLRMLVDPQPYVRHRHSCGQWWFAEELYRQVIASGLGG